MVETNQRRKTKKKTRKQIKGRYGLAFKLMELCPFLFQENTFLLFRKCIGFDVILNHQT